MKFILAPVVALGLAASTAFAQTFMINTPTNPVVCQPVLITWIGGTPPYFVSILPGGDPTAAAIITFNSTSATSLTWLVDVASGTSLGLDIRDSTGTVAQSAAFTIQSGTDSSCVGKVTSATFGTTAAAGATPTGSQTGATQTTPNTSSNSKTSAGSAASATSAGATSTSTTATKSAGASRVTGQFAAAGIIGAAMVALLG